MSITFHPDDATLVAYAAGTLDEAFGIVVACHLESCTSCRRSLKALEMVGGAELDAIDNASLESGSFDRLLEKIEAEGVPHNQSDVTDVTKDASSVEPDDTPLALQKYLDERLSDVKWKRVSPGVWQRRIEISKGAKSSLRLLRIAPGKKVPEHGHHGQEVTLILSGAYQDEIGKFGPGDVADLDVDIEHQPHVISQVDCICLAATEAPTKFKGLISRLLQPVFGI